MFFRCKYILKNLNNATSSLSIFGGPRWANVFGKLVHNVMALFRYLFYNGLCEIIFLSTFAELPTGINSKTDL